MAIRYICKCQDCKHQWTSRLGSGTPEECPKCRSRRISMSPLEGPR
jgi:Zn finger protein HypA/HybF involved in hydrogenase expression